MYIVAGLVIALAAGLAAGIEYQYYGSRRDRTRWPMPGRIVETDAAHLHVYDTGQGSPAVILEAGIGSTTLNWRALLQRIAEFTRVLSYDRAGLGFSGPASSPRTPSSLVAELRTALSRVGVLPPYVLVGHSFGGLVVRWFAAKYPDEVAGVVLLDALRPEDWTPISDQQRRMLKRGVRLLSRGEALARVGVVRFCLAAVLGGSRLLPRAIGKAASGRGASVMDRIAGEIAKMPREVWAVIAAQWSNPASFAGLRAHLRDLPLSIGEIGSAPALGDMPVTVITAGGQPPIAEAALRAISPRAKHIIAEKSGHWIHLDEPELVLRLIREAVDNARRPA